ncbi:hypothetical protein P175DRAFT_0498970 [Aspergillus ochraceoroseus IBT 24754]|uniref:MICOS complex subunit MIC12 n=3 Tax=Aspergillus subgen. Nidulantes TaxID=2720870 RepID=A0A0F8WL03_9EURO|nr:uncharacterized protein P175DRAFT_0498970 [Aspergillus ochraceoroseus IBT 24754]KKK18415.1 hypothetical protein ARAM_003013 [Aspergillus rambellii]KKK18923.1 hypothetical protein AOCH_005975 [Aspergillus ochraceoroseus]PTU22436.1 hypothetical protein P175DRAFT_0498970 [Aspergillus ochraceoroseus IBT 24754]
MGFFAGFFSGFALTTSMLYLTVQVHRSTRIDQRDAIREQTQNINWLALSTGAYDRRLIPSDIPRSKEGAATPQMKDKLKHRWNEEVQKLARKAYDSRWDGVRDTAAEGWKSVKRLVKRD